MTLKELVEQSKTVIPNVLYPIKKGFITLKTPEGDILANMSNPDIAKEVFKSPYFHIVDRLVFYMISNKIEQLVFTADGTYSRNIEGDLQKDFQLTKFNSEKHLNSIRKYLDLEVETKVRTDLQGMRFFCSYWKKDDQYEFVIKVEEISDFIYHRIKPLFEVNSGVIIVTNGILPFLSELLEQKGKYRRVLSSGGGNPVHVKKENVEGIIRYVNLSSNVDIQEMKEMECEVYVISLSSIEDVTQLCHIPVNKLCVLSVPDVNSTEKCLHYLHLLCGGANTIAWRIVITNLVAVVSLNPVNPYIVLDEWSKRMLMADNQIDTVSVMNHLKSSFKIRDIAKAEGDIVDITAEIDLMLKYATDRGASNIDICPGTSIRMYKGKVTYEPYSDIIMTPDLVETILINMITPEESSLFYKKGEIDSSYSVKGLGRFRLGAVRQRSSIAVSIRSVPTVIPEVKNLGLPKEFIDRSINNRKGFTLILGEPNSGKTYTFNTLIDIINENTGGIIFLMGSPIEFIHKHKKALVLQVEIGSDLPTYSEGIAKSLRMNTSVLAFEELRTKEEFNSLGALINSPNMIFMTMHASSCANGLELLIRRLTETGVSASKAKEDIADSLNSVIYQKLIEDPKDRNKRILIYEYLFATPTICNIIRSGDIKELRYYIESNFDDSCKSMDRVILEKLKSGELEYTSVIDSIVGDRQLFVPWRK